MASAATPLAVHVRNTLEDLHDFYSKIIRRLNEDIVKLEEEFLTITAHSCFIRHDIDLNLAKENDFRKLREILDPVVSVIGKLVIIYKRKLKSVERQTFRLYFLEHCIKEREIERYEQREKGKKTTGEIDE